MSKLTMSVVEGLHW